MSIDKWKREWSSDEFGRAYGDLFFQRATGELPEMESSKSAANRLENILKEGDKLLDVGCGAGHYYASYKKNISNDFLYTGVDATQNYVDLAKKAFKNDSNCEFQKQDIFDLEFDDASFDIVTCFNVLLHMPTIKKPISELCRVASKRLMLRTLISDSSYIIKDIMCSDVDDEFDEDEEPNNFHYLNIYSENYLKKILSNIGNIKKIKFEIDKDFDSSAVEDTKNILETSDATSVVNGKQISGLILMPWTWVDIEFS